MTGRSRKRKKQSMGDRLRGRTRHKMTQRERIERAALAAGLQLDHHNLGDLLRAACMTPHDVHFVEQLLWRREDMNESAIICHGLDALRIT